MVHSQDRDEISTTVTTQLGV